MILKEERVDKGESGSLVEDYLQTRHLKRWVARTVEFVVSGNKVHGHRRMLIELDIVLIGRLNT